MSLTEWKSSVIRGIAVTTITVSSATQNTASARETSVIMKARLLGFLINGEGEVSLAPF